MSNRPGVSALERVEALLDNEALYALAELVPACQRMRAVVVGTIPRSWSCCTKR